MKEKGYKLFTVYYYIVFVLAVFGLIDSLVSGPGGVSDSSSAVEILSSVFVLVFLVFSIVALIKFIERKLHPVTWVMPIYYIAVPVILFIWGMVMAATGSSEAAIDAMLDSRTFYNITLVMSLFEVLVSGYVLYRFEWRR